MEKPLRPAVEEVDILLRTDSYLWGVLRSRGRERRLEAELLKEINDLLDLRLNIMAADEEEKKR